MWPSTGWGGEECPGCWVLKTTEAEPLCHLNHVSKSLAGWGAWLGTGRGPRARVCLEVKKRERPNQ